MLQRAEVVKRTQIHKCVQALIHWKVSALVRSAALWNDIH